MTKKELIEICLRCIQAYSTEKEWTKYSSICQERLEKLDAEKLQFYIDCYAPNGMIKADGDFYDDFYWENNPLRDYCAEIVARYSKSPTILNDIKDPYRTFKTI